jgi:hypothetical protein
MHRERLAAEDKARKAEKKADADRRREEREAEEKRRREEREYEDQRWQRMMQSILDAQREQAQQSREIQLAMIQLLRDQQELPEPHPQ